MDLNCNLTSTQRNKSMRQLFYLSRPFVKVFRGGEVKGDYPNLFFQYLREC